MEYIESGHDTDRCIFCEHLAANDDEGSYILTRGRRAFAILNAYPYNPGHLLVAPLRVRAEIGESCRLRFLFLKEQKIATPNRGF